MIPVSNLEHLNKYLLKVMAAYAATSDGRHFNVPLEDKVIDLAISLKELKILQASLEFRIENTHKDD